MRVLVAGATSVLGPPTLRALRAAGHETFGLTRAVAKRSRIAEAGAQPLVADVFDGGSLRAAFAASEPQAVVSLLVALPRQGPRRVGDFEESRRLWEQGLPMLLTQAAAAGVERLIAESFIFGYGYGRHRQRVTEETPALDDGAIRGHRAVLASVRAMEARVLRAPRPEGIVLRFGVLHGAGVPSTDYMIESLRRRMLPLPGGGHGLLSWIDLDDAAAAVVAALERGRGGQLYNIVDDLPVEFGDYAHELSRVAGAPRPRAIPLWLGRLVAPHAATLLGHTRLGVANAKAKRELSWEPRYASYRETIGSLRERRG